jgi:hypothetical protein
MLNKSVDLWPVLLLDVKKLFRMRNRKCSWKLAPADKLIFVIRHIEGSVKSVLQVTLLGVRYKLRLFFHFVELREVNKFNSLIPNADIIDQVTHLAIRGFIEVCKHTVFKLGAVVKLFLVSSDFFNDLGTINVRVPQQVSDLGLVNGHALFFCEVHGLDLVAIPVLKVEIFLLRDLGHLLLDCRGYFEIVDKLILKLLMSFRCATTLIVEQVNKFTLFFRSQ